MSVTELKRLLRYKPSGIFLLFSRFCFLLVAPTHCWDAVLLFLFLDIDGWGGEFSRYDARVSKASTANTADMVFSASGTSKDKVRNECLPLTSSFWSY